MNISKDKQFITIPIDQYEKMVEVVNNKKDIMVTFYLNRPDRYGFSYNIFTYNSIHELNDKLTTDDVNKTTELINEAVKYTEELKNKEIKDLINELSNIKSKWYFKLFGR